MPVDARNETLDKSGRPALCPRYDMEFSDAEKYMLENSKRCDECGHLKALHNQHCCCFCTVPKCKCRECV